MIASPDDSTLLDLNVAFTFFRGDPCVKKPAISPRLLPGRISHFSILRAAPRERIFVAFSMDPCEAA